MHGDYDIVLAHIVSQHEVYTSSACDTNAVKGL